MKFTGEYRIDASREAVWAAINDPAVLRRCIPGCEDIVRETPTDWQARVLMRVGPVKARFNGQIRLEDLDPPAGCRIVGEGSGGAAGFAQGGATVRLRADGAATVLTYEADAQIGGKLAQIGSRLIDSFARRYADDFFAAFARIVGAEAETGMTEAATPGGLPPIGHATTADLGATAVLAADPVPMAPTAAVPPAIVTPPPLPPAPSPSPPSSSSPTAPAFHDAPAQSRGFDPQTFTVIVLALLLVFMTIMFALKP